MKLSFETSPSYDWPADAEPPAGGRRQGVFGEGRVKPDNPWLPISDRMRYFLVGALVVYTLVCVLGALTQSALNPASPLLALSDLVYLTVLAFPLLAYNKDKSGWFHPLVFATLWTVVKSLPRRTGFFIFGLQEHAVLHLSAEELTRLVAYENFLNALALVSTYVGFYLVRSPRLPRLRLRPPRHIWWVVAGTAVVGLGALAVYIKLSGSLTQHFLNLSLNSAAKSFVTDDVSGVGLLSTVAQWFALALAMTLAYRPEALRKPVFWAACLLALVMAYLAAGKRSELLTPIATGTIAWMLTVRRVPVFRLLLLGAVILVGFSFLLVVRKAATMARDFGDVKTLVSENADASVSAGLDELSYRLGGYSSVYPILYYVPDQSPLLWGSSYLLLLGRPIPRAIWPSKPRGTDFMAGMVFFGSPWGIPPGPVGEAYWNFHVPGVIGVFLLFGIFNRWLAGLYVKYRAHGLMVFFYVYTVFSLVPAENAITGWMQGLIPVLLFGFATGILRPGSRSSA